MLKQVNHPYQHIYNFLEKTIYWIAVVFFSLISILNCLFTTKTTNYGDLYAVKFTPIASVAMMLVMVLAIFAVFFLCKNIKAELHTIVTIVFLFGLVESLLWIFIADVKPVFDSLDLAYATEALMGSTEDLAVVKWAYASYLSRFPFQTSIVSLLYFCMTIAGENYVILYEVINCFACAFAMTGIVKLTNELSKDKGIIILSSILSVGFLPIVLYCTFVYGNIIALPFLIYSFYFQNKFLSEDKKNYFHLLASIMLMGVAIFIKSTMIIGALAETCIYLFWLLNEPKRKKCLFAIVCIVCTLKMSSVFFAPVNSFIKSKIDIDLNNGLPSITWITMGLGGGTEYQADLQNDPSLATNIENAGYYDGFVWSLSEAEYSKEAMTALSKEYLSKRIQHFISDPHLMFEFMKEKFMITWTNPDYESFHASNWNSEQANGYNQATRSLTKFAWSLYYGKTHRLLLCVMDALQTVLSAGVVWWLLFRKEKAAVNIEIIAILGYVAVYLLWETKTQYMFPAYLLMIPTAVHGWKLMYSRLVIRH